MKLKLVVATDRHFAWMLGECAAPRGLSQPPGGIDSDDTLKMLRGLARSLRRRSCKASWLVVDKGVVIGLTCLLHAPDAAGQAIFGYGVAPACRGKGYGRAMVAAVIRRVRAWPTLRILRAETRVDNLASQHILAQNGFVRLGSRIDTEDGLVTVWQRDLRRWYLPHPLHLAHRVRRLYRGTPVDG